MSGNLLITQGLGADSFPLQTLSVVPAATSVTLVFETDLVLTGAAMDAANWGIAPAITVAAVTVLSVVVSGFTVVIQTTEHQRGGSYTLTVPQGVVDASDGRPFVGPFSLVYVGVGDLPYIVMARGVDERTMDVVFSEPVREDDATIPTNYTISGSVSVISVVKVTDVTYQLTTTGQDRVTSYTVEVDNVRDLANNPIDTTT